MDLITYALSKKYTDNKIAEIGTAEGVIPTIGENGNWFIQGIDTGFKAVAQENVEVDGKLKVDTEARNIAVVKDGTETIVGEYTTGIELNDIAELFE